MTIAGFGRHTNPPPGTILVWAEPLSSIPVGWAICDGNNGTPNMLGRFARSVDNGTTDPGATGGQDSLTVSTAQLPSHTHTITLDAVGDHNHPVPGYKQGWSGNDYYRPTGGGSDWVSNQASHSHSLIVQSVGGGSVSENRPAYHEVAYIMKL